VHEGADRDVHLAARGPSAGAAIAGDSARLATAIDAIFRAVLREKAGPATIVVERRLEDGDGGRRAVVIVADEESAPAAYAATPGEFDEKRGGLGLALPLARRVVEGHGGRLWSPASHAGAANTAGEDALSRGSILFAIPVT
jgi:hypothetical protein